MAMTAEHHSHERRRHLPPVESLERRPVSFVYNELADELVVAFTDPPRPAVTVFVNDWVAIRVDPESGEVVGIQVVNFLQEARWEIPSVRELARNLGIEDSKRLVVAGSSLAADPRHRAIVREVLAATSMP
jgi:hypothetical protein